jgi:hypothetical protein
MRYDIRRMMIHDSIEITGVIFRFLDEKRALIKEILDVTKKLNSDAFLLYILTKNDNRNRILS